MRISAAAPSAQKRMAVSLIAWSGPAAPRGGAISLRDANENSIAKCEMSMSTTDAFGGRLRNKI